MQSLINRIWYGNHWARYLLWPLSWLFGLISASRRLAFRLGLKPRYHLPVPVILVGNITVGGSGKTPLVIYLVHWLRQQGYHPGVISRGYGSQTTNSRMVLVADSAARVGDEPAMIVARTGVPMAVGSDRIATAQLLLSQAKVDIIISDDGLQHYRMARDIELLVLDEQRQLGNGWLLPAGPLREGRWRLSTVDLVVRNGATEDGAQGFAMQLQAGRLQPVRAAVADAPAQPIVPEPPAAVVAMAGIGHPERFFDTLNTLGYQVAETVVFADHHPYCEADFAQFNGNMPLLMTEKDAVKCRQMATANSWYLPVDAVLSTEFEARLLSRIRAVKARYSN